MNKQYEVHKLNESDVYNFLLNFFKVSTLDSLISRNISGSYSLQNFKYVNNYVWDSIHPEGHHVLIFIDKKKHEIAAVIDYWDSENPNYKRKDMSFVDFNDSYSDEKVKKLLPDFFDVFAKQLNVKEIHDVIQNEYDKELGMQTILTQVMKDNGIKLIK